MQANVHGAQRDPPMITAIDLFCGVGGLTYGLRRAGVKVVAGVDIDPACAFPFTSNNGGTAFLQTDVASLQAKQLRRYFRGHPGIKLLAGCAPCQPFSSHNKGRDRTADGDWGLLYKFSELTAELKPQLVTMENVPRLRGHKVFEDFISSLERAGYHVSTESVRCEDIGIPQRRRRLVLLASRFAPIEFTYGRSRPLRSVADAIGKLPPVLNGGMNRRDPLHRARNLGVTNLERLRHSRPGGSWEEWPRNLRAPCHRKKTGSSYRSVYARMSWDEPSPTITTQFFNFGAGRFGHPEQDRPITLREGAVLQSFPRKYRFVRSASDIDFSNVGRLIGNAVPPKLGERIGRILVHHVLKHAPLRYRKLWAPR